MKELLQSHGFMVRLKVSLGIIVVMAIGLATPNALGFRIVYNLAAVMSVAEIMTFGWDKKLSERSRQCVVHVIISNMVLGFSVASVLTLPKVLLVIGVVLTMASDVGAYFFGKLLGTRLIKTRPFPEISPTKSWEGLIGGMLLPALLVPILNLTLAQQLPGEPLPWILGCLVGLCAIIGDTSESALKRRFGLKDANDNLKQLAFFGPIEALLGGRDGHGGYYDRLDSLSVVMTWLGIAILIIYLAH